MKNKIPFIVLIATMTSVIACNKGYGGGHGWGEPVIILPKPTLIPKLKQAYIDGKLSVDYHKIIAPSLKPLPYKKGIGWIGKDWGFGWGHHEPVGHHGHGHGGYGFNHFDYPIEIGKTGHLGVGYGKGYGYGKGAGIGFGKGVGHLGPVGHGPVGGLGHHVHEHHEHHVEHHVPVTPIAPILPKLPIPHGPGGQFGHHHTVSENAVTVVEKGHAGHHEHIGNELYGKK